MNLTILERPQLDRPPSFERLANTTQETVFVELRSFSVARGEDDDTRLV
jgi:hypothetical protein